MRIKPESSKSLVSPTFNVVAEESIVAVMFVSLESKPKVDTLSTKLTSIACLTAAEFAIDHAVVVNCALVQPVKVVEVLPV